MIEKVEIKSESGHMIRGVFNVPENAKMLIIVCHGFGSSMDDTFKKHYEAVILKMPMGVIRFDFSGHGTSEGKLEDMNLSKGVLDLEAMVEEVQSRYKDLPMMIYGRSFGGNVAYIYACSKKQERFNGLFKGMVLNAPSFDFKRIQDANLTSEEIEAWKTKGYYENDKGFRLNYSFYQDLEIVPKYEVHPALEIKTLIIHGSADKIVSLEQSQELEKISKYVTLHVVEGAGHGFRDKEHLNESLEMTMMFIEETLRAMT